MDLAGPMNGHYLLVVVDARSRWPEVKILNRITSSAILSALDEIFPRFGNPEVLVSDNGTQFKSGEVREFCKKRNISQMFSAPFHPQSNGLAEKFVDTVKQSLQKMTGEGNHPSYEPNDQVYTTVYERNRGKWKAGRIKEGEATNMYDILIGDEVHTRHTNQMKKRYNDSPSIQSTWEDLNLQLALYLRLSTELGPTPQNTPEVVASRDAPMLTGTGVPRHYRMSNNKDHPRRHSRISGEPILRSFGSDTSNIPLDSEQPET